MANKESKALVRSSNLHLWGVALLTLIAWEVYMGKVYDQLKEELLGRTDMLTIASDNNILRWEYRANVQVFDHLTHYDVRTNNYGFRDRVFNTVKTQDGKNRIAFIGDSVTFGMKENVENIFVRMFEVNTNAQTDRQSVEALNFGVDGYNTLQVGELLNEVVIQFHPDEVIYVLCVNDFNFESLEGDMRIFFDKPTSYTAQALQRILMRLSTKDTHMIYFDKYKEKVFSLISDMRERTAERNIDFSVVLVPAFYSDETSFDGYPLVRMHEETANALTGMGIQFIDLLPSFRETRLPPGHFAHDIWHLNKAGHEHVAAELSRDRTP